MLYKTRFSFKTTLEEICVITACRSDGSIVFGSVAKFFSLLLTDSDDSQFRLLVNIKSNSERFPGLPGKWFPHVSMTCQQEMSHWEVLIPPGTGIGCSPMLLANAGLFHLLVPSWVMYPSIRFNCF